MDLKTAVSKTDFVRVWVLFSDSEQNSVEMGKNRQSQEAQRNCGTDLLVLFLLPLRTSLRFSGFSRPSLASSG